MGEKSSPASHAELLPDARFSHLRTVALIYGAMLVAVECEHAAGACSRISAVPSDYLSGEGTEYYVGCRGDHALPHPDDSVCRIHADRAHAAILHGRNSVPSLVAALQAAGQGILYSLRRLPSSMHVAVLDCALSQPLLPAACR